MAANSIREQIIVYLATMMGTLSSIKTVVRTKQTYSNLQQFAVTQLPLIAVVGRLPIPVEKISSRLGGGHVDLIISELNIDLYVYFQEKENPDKRLSTLADDIWAKAYSNETLGDLALSLTVNVTEEPEYWDPFVAFRVTVKIKYKHTTGGI